MTQELWTAVDCYIGASLIPADEVMDEVVAANSAAELPAIDVTPNQGKLLHLLARIRGAKRILEVGTLGGYSTVWMARALPAGGRLVTLEINQMHAEVAAANFERARLSSVIELRVGPALESLAMLVAEGAEPFDFIFIDADKPNNAAYLYWALRLSRPGTVIVGDNVIRDGAVIEADHDDPAVHGARKLFEALSSEPGLDSTAIQTVGSKGHDGFTLSVVTRTS